MILYMGVPPEIFMVVISKGSIFLIIYDNLILSGFIKHWIYFCTAGNRGWLEC